MSSDEEYLDDLLKSIMENEDENEDNPSGAEDEADTEAVTEGTQENAPTDGDLAVEDDFFLNDFAIQEPDIDDIDVEHMNLEEDSEEEADNDSSDISDIMSADEISAMFTGVEESPDEEGIDESEASLGEDSFIEGVDEEKMFGSEGAAFDSVDEAPGSEGEIFDSMEENDSDAADDSLNGIDSLLGNDNEEMEADDMLALLESMSAEMSEDEALAAGAAAAAGAVPVVSDEDMEEGGGKKKKGVFSKLFGKKKKGKEEKSQDEKEFDSIEVDIEQAEESEDAPEGMALETPVKKKQGIFAKALSFLTESDEGTDEAEKLKAAHGMSPSDENRDILEELDAEDKKKKKKKAKGKKGDASEDGAADGKKAKEKKKKEKKPKPVKEEAAEPVSVKKPRKRVSGKNIMIITALCLTLSALVIVIVSVVPDFFEKRTARDAYYEADYALSYDLLYGKKLDESDTIIYNKSKVIMNLNRKLSSYHNYMSMGKELEALDALMMGVEKYPEIITEAKDYNAAQEVDAVYATILNILSDKYDLSEEVAKVIIDYDDLTYTRKLESIVYKTPFVLPEQEEESIEAASVDILPEEQDIIEESALPEQAPAVQEVSDSSDSDSSNEAAQDEEQLPSDTADSVQNINDSPVQEQAGEIPAQTTESSGSQGQLIQGVKQPLEFQINGN